MSIDSVGGGHGARGMDSSSGSNDPKAELKTLLENAQTELGVNFSKDHAIGKFLETGKAGKSLRKGLDELLTCNRAKKLSDTTLRGLASLRLGKPISEKLTGRDLRKSIQVEIRSNNTAVSSLSQRPSVEEVAKLSPRKVIASPISVTEFPVSKVQQSASKVFVPIVESENIPNFSKRGAYAPSLLSELPKGYKALEMPSPTGKVEGSTVLRGKKGTDLPKVIVRDSSIPAQEVTRALKTVLPSNANSKTIVVIDRASTGEVEARLVDKKEVSKDERALLNQMLPKSKSVNSAQIHQALRSVNINEMDVRKGPEGHKSIAYYIDIKAPHSMLIAVGKKTTEAELKAGIAEAVKYPDSFSVIEGAKHTFVDLEEASGKIYGPVPPPIGWTFEGGKYSTTIEGLKIETQKFPTSSFVNKTEKRFEGIYRMEKGSIPLLESSRAQEMLLRHDVSFEITIKGKTYDVHGLGRDPKSGQLRGTGSFGRVFVGVDRATGERVAIKHVKALKGSVGGADLKGEPRLMLDLSGTNDHLVSASRIGFTNNAVFIVMKEMDAGDLTGKILRGGSSNKALLLNLQQATKGLVAMHAKNIIHRDIKGANIMLDSKKGAALGDFGTCVRLKNGEAKKQDIAGSPMFVAPEVMRGVESGKPSDIWSLGVTLYTCLEGQVPPKFDGEAGKFLIDPRKINWQNFERTKGAALTQLMRAMLDFNPARRPTAEQVHTVLNHILSAQT